MTSVGSVSSAQTQAAGLPPVNLANAATANTVNAGLVSGLLGVDPSSVAGVYGGSAANNMFSNVFTLPMLSNLSGATAEQALSLLGIQAPAAGTAATTDAASSSAAPSAADSMDAWNAAPDPASDPGTNWLTAWNAEPDANTDFASMAAPQVTSDMASPWGTDPTG